MDQEPIVDSLVVGLTRPPMMLGVPYMAFVVNGLLTVCLFIATAALTTFLVALPIHLLLFLGTSLDVRMLDILQVLASRCPRTMNKEFWGANAYAP